VLKISYFDINNMITAFFQKYNILDRLNDIEKWKNETADPTLSANVIKIQTINTNITQNIVPQIQESVSIAKNASSTAIGASNNAISASNIAVEAKNTAEQFLTRIQEAETNAINASTNATNAFKQVQDFATRLTNAGTQLQADVDAVLEEESKFRTALSTEIDAIRRQMNELAAAVDAAGENVKKEGEDVSRELNEVNTEMQRPISDIKEYLRRLREHDPIYIPFNAGMTIALIASSDAILTLQTLTGPPENKTLYDYYKQSAHGSIVEEVVEGFQEVGREFLDIGKSLEGFAGTIDAEFKKMGDRLLLSSEVINKAFKEFIDKFHKIFFNLSFTLRGEIPPTQT
jgi:hypothetical protein